MYYMALSLVELLLNGTRDQGTGGHVSHIDDDVRGHIKMVVGMNCCANISQSLKL